MTESLGTYLDINKNEQLSINEKNDSNLNMDTKKISIEDSMKKSKAYSILNVLDSQGEQISKENEKIYISILEKKDISFLNELSQKSKIEIKQFLIQSQIDELEAKGLENFTGKDRVKYSELSDRLIATKNLTIAQENQKQAQENQKQVQENQKQAQENQKQAEENQKQAEENQKQAEQKEIIKDNTAIMAQLSSIKGSLSILQGQNKNVKNIFTFIADAENLKELSEGTSGNEQKELSNKIKEKLNNIINIIKDSVALRSISKDLKEYDQKNGTKTYDKFKSVILDIDPSVNFEGVDNFDFVGNIAKIKLSTNDLTGVELDSDILSQTTDDITTKYSKEDGTTQNYNGKDYKVPVEMNPEYEKKLIRVHNQANKKIKPIENNIKVLENVSEQLEKIKNTGVDFSKLKEQVKTQNPNLYNKLLLETKTSYDDMFQELNIQKSEFEDKKKNIKEKTNDIIAELITKNIKETKEKNKNKREMLRFFNDIAFDELQQTKTDKLINYMNINPGNFDLQYKIDINNGDLGFDKDFGDKKINPAEKVAFIKLFNRMLGENIVDENIAYGTTTLSIKARNRIQVLQNKNTGYFMNNLQKKDNIT